MYLGRYKSTRHWNKICSQDSWQQESSSFPCTRVNFSKYWQLKNKVRQIYFTSKTPIFFAMELKRPTLNPIYFYPIVFISYSSIRKETKEMKLPQCIAQVIRFSPQFANGNPWFVYLILLRNQQRNECKLFLYQLEASSSYRQQCQNNSAIHIRSNW